MVFRTLIFLARALLQIDETANSNLSNNIPNHLFTIMALLVDCEFVSQLHLSLLYMHVGIAKSENINFCSKSSGELSVRKFFS